MENKFNFKELQNRPDRLAPGHRMCAGCGGTIAVRNVLKTVHEGDKVVVGNATGCLEVSTFTYPYNSYESSYIHTAFAGAGASLAGVETAYNALKKRGKIDDTYKFITFGGDGQARKDLVAVMAAHNIPYTAQTTFIGNMKDLYEKSEKAIYTPGPAFLNIMAPCPRGWRFDAADMAKICKLAVDTCYWPLYEFDHGKWIINYEPKNKLPIEDFLKPQGRFKHLFKKGNEDLLVAFQEEVDRRWEELQAKANM